MNIISGIGAIFLVLFILAMKESENKVVGYIGLGVIVVARLAAGSEGIEESTAILLIIGIISVIATIQYFKVRKEREVYETLEREYSILKAQEEFKKLQERQELLLRDYDERNHFLAAAEEEFNNKIEHINLLFMENKISLENYEKSIKGIEKKYSKIRESVKYLV